jgi:hypothetical protein
VRCICDGILCRVCGENRVHRPLSDHVARETGKTWHVPWFGYLIPCAECRAPERRRV